MLRFLEKYDTVNHPLGIPSECLQSLDARGKITVRRKAKKYPDELGCPVLSCEGTGLKLNIVLVRVDFKGMGAGQAVFESGKRVSDVVVVD